MHFRVDCTIRWTREENTSVDVVGRFVGWLSESDCMASCLVSPSCVAIEIHGSLACLLHHDAGVLGNTSFKDGVTVLILHRCHTSPRSTESSPQSTISVGNVTGM